MNIHEQDIDIQGQILNPEQDLSGEQLYHCLKKVFKIDFVSGLPCGELQEFIRVSEADQEIIHVPATNERESIGIAAGAWLGGKTPVLYMQNSGLFEASNDLGSLMIAAKIPTVFVVSWRGAPGETATQHLATGEATQPLLDSFNLSFTDKTSEQEIIRLKTQQEQTGLPVFILRTRENFNEPDHHETPKSVSRSRTEVTRDLSSELSSREEVLRIIANMTPQSRALFSSTGLISRSLFHHSDSPNQFYNAGALGLTSALGLGFAVAQPETPVTVVEGDGSVLTDLGNLNLIGHQQPKHFLHILLDDGSYTSCSGEPTVGSELIPDLASVFGYSHIFSIASTDVLQTIINDVNNSRLPGPIMIHMRINKEGGRNFNRPLGMAEIAARFRKHFQLK